MTPAEAALIKVDGRNKWMTLIQNAALHKIHGWARSEEMPDFRCLRCYRTPIRALKRLALPASLSYDSMMCVGPDDIWILLPLPGCPVLETG